VFLINSRRGIFNSSGPSFKSQPSLLPKLQEYFAEFFKPHSLNHRTASRCYSSVAILVRYCNGFSRAEAACQKVLASAAPPNRLTLIAAAFQRQAWRPTNASYTKLSSKPTVLDDTNRYVVFALLISAYSPLKFTSHSEQFRNGQAKRLLGVTTVRSATVACT